MKGGSATSTMVKLANLKMEPDQDIKEYWYTVKKECHQANDRMDTASIVSWFVNGLPPKIKEAIVEQTSEMDKRVVELACRKQLTMRIRKKGLTKVKSPVEMILEEEPWEMPPDEKREDKEIIQQIKGIQLQKEESKEDKTRAEIKRLKRSIWELDKKIQSSNDHRLEKEPRRKEISCFKCHQKGHIKRDCPLRKPSQEERRHFKRREQNNTPVAKRPRRDGMASSSIL